MMKAIVTIVRILTGGLFVFSGLVKAIDPRGLSYKMQEFFEAWSHSGFLPGMMQWLGNFALTFSIIIITLEVLAGLALLLGWRPRFTVRLLFLLIVFFTFLTAYVLFSGKIRACGCFGDCIPLTPVQTFTKDLILLAFGILLMWKNKWIQPLFSPGVLKIVLLLSAGATLFLQWYVQRYLPLKDCLPFKAGNNIWELRKMPANAVPDKYAMSFVYQKGGEIKSFGMDALPDSTWTFVERKQVLIEKGKNNVPPITDFVLTTASGTDTTAAILQQTGLYYLLFVKNINGLPAGFKADQQLLVNLAQKGIACYIISADSEQLKSRYDVLLANGQPLQPILLNCDATTVKTAARADMVLYKMQGPVVQQKWGWADIKKVKP